MNEERLCLLLLKILKILLLFILELENFLLIPQFNSCWLQVIGLEYCPQMAVHLLLKNLSGNQ